MPFLNVKVVMNEAARQFPELWKKHTSMAARAINATMSEARKRATADTAADLRLPQRIVSRRLTRYGSNKEARTWISRRAKPWDLNGTVTVYMRGIPFFQIAGAQTRAGVKGRGGRLLKGGFRVPSGPYEGMVFQRIRPKPGGTRQHLDVGRINIERTFRRRFDQHITGASGLALFRRKYAEIVRKDAAKYGVRA